MAGNTESAKRAAQTNKDKYGEDYYREIGALGGKANKKPRWLQLHPEKAREIGRKGGRPRVNHEIHTYTR